MEQHQTFAIAKRLLDEMVKQGKNEISSSDVRVYCKSDYAVECVFTAIEILFDPVGFRIDNSTGDKVVYFTK